MFWLDSQQELNPCFGESYYPQGVRIMPENTVKAEMMYSCMCACVCVEGVWRGRERLLVSAYDYCYYIGGTLLHLNGLQGLYLSSKGSDGNEGRNWQTDPLALWLCDWFFLPELQYPLFGKSYPRERHTQNKLSQLDTKAEVLSQLMELFNIGTARNLKMVIWQIRKQVQRSKFI